ncbi:MAG: major coat protein [Desulfovibrio sp.]
MQLRHKLVFASVLAAASVSSAMADVPPALTAAMTGIQTDAGAIRDLVLPVVIAILGMTIGIKLVKRFANKI